MRALILTFVLLLLAFVSLIIGVGDLSVSLVTLSRAPRTASLILAGIGMSISGVIMQQMTQNKFVSPTTAGTLEAAKIGLLIFLIFTPEPALRIRWWRLFSLRF